MRAVTALALALVACGCGYRFVAGGAPLPEGIRSVHSPVFVNRTSEPGVEALFTQAFREQLTRAGVNGGGDSESRIEGEILAVSGVPTIAAPHLGLAGYRLSASARLRLVKGGRVLSEAQVSGAEDYLPGADVLLSESNRQAALQRLAGAMMRDGYDRLATGW